VSLELVFSDDALRRTRARRVDRLLHASAIATIVVCAVWLAFALAHGYLLVAAVEGAGIAAGIVLLRVLRQDRPNFARHLTMVVLLGLVASVIALEGNAPGRAPDVHLYLICLAVGSYLVFFDASPRVPASYTAICAALFLARELGWLTFAPMGPDDPAVDRLASNASVLALFAIVITLTWMFVRDTSAAERHLAHANERLEVLLESMLPESVARRLREEGHTFADKVDGCTILVADIVGFTRMASERPPAEVVAILDDLFSRFDTLCERIGVEKIKTVGDAYVAVAGVPAARPDHAAAAAELAIAMQAVAREAGIGLRIGINTGTVVAGVIGKKRFIYDLWGDAVNVAADLEASAVPGGIQITENTWRELDGAFVAEPRGEIEVRGGRRIRAWQLKGRGLGPA
jgi:adenylate cyclase